MPELHLSGSTLFHNNVQSGVVVLLVVVLVVVLVVLVVVVLVVDVLVVLVVVVVVVVGPAGSISRTYGLLKVLP